MHLSRLHRNRFTVVTAVAAVALACSVPSSVFGQQAPGVARHAVHRPNWISAQARRESSTRGLLFVADIGAGAVDLFSRNDPSKLLGQIVDLISFPSCLAVDSSGDLFVANGANNILEFVPPYSGPPVATYQFGQTGTNGLLIGPDQTLYASGTIDAQIVEYKLGNPNPQIIFLPVGPVGLALDGSGNLFASYNGFGASGVFELPASDELVQGQYDPTNLGIPLKSWVRDIAFDRSGNLVVDDGDAAVINVYPPGSTKPMRTIDSGFINPVSMAFDPEKKHLYVSDIVAANVKELSYPSGDVLQTISGSFTEPFGVAVSGPAHGRR